jgi:hypothetical protein
MKISKPPIDLIFMYPAGIRISFNQKKRLEKLITLM